MLIYSIIIVTMIRNSVKQFFLNSPEGLRRLVVATRELYYRLGSLLWEKYFYPSLPKIPQRTRPIKTVLIYMITGMHHSGTEKSLQQIANSLADDYKVLFMFGDKHIDANRQHCLDPRIKQVPFSYERSDTDLPHRLYRMQPHLKEIIEKNDVDVLITSSPGYAHYPWNVITNIPIILLNIFGAPTLQKNITATVFISQTTLKHASSWTGAIKNAYVKYLPCGPVSPDTKSLGESLRRQLNIEPTDFVFGRIGRADNNIYDPIGLKAWRRIAHRYHNAHLIIKSPPPILIEALKAEPLPNVHLLPASGKEEDIWGFHGSLDAMAHFRHDGETSGVAIEESLAVGNPVITHRSHIWNAHLEYLDDSCARVAGLDDDEAYASYMEEFIHLKNSEPANWEQMRQAANTKAAELFSPEGFGDLFKKLLRTI